MDGFKAQYRAVIAGAQIAAALPDVQADIRLASGAADSDWQVIVTWSDGPDLAEMRRILDGPPPGVLLLRDVAIPDPDRQPDA